MESAGRDTRVRQLAATNLFSIFEELCEGAISVDQSARIVWINEKYLALLGFDESDDLLGQDN